MRRQEKMTIKFERPKQRIQTAKGSIVLEPEKGIGSKYKRNKEKQKIRNCIDSQI